MLYKNVRMLSEAKLIVVFVISGRTKTSLEEQSNWQVNGLFTIATRATLTLNVCSTQTKGCIIIFVCPEC